MANLRGTLRSRGFSAGAGRQALPVKTGFARLRSKEQKGNL